MDYIIQPDPNAKPLSPEEREKYRKRAELVLEIGSLLTKRQRLESEAASEKMTHAERVAEKMEEGAIVVGAINLVETRLAESIEKKALEGIRAALPSGGADIEAVEKQEHTDPNQENLTIAMPKKNCCLILGWGKPRKAEFDELNKDGVCRMVSDNRQKWKIRLDHPSIDAGIRKRYADYQNDQLQELQNQRKRK